MNRRPLDALLLFILLIARVRIDTLAGLVAVRTPDLLARLGLLPPESVRLLEDWLVDPYSLVLIAVAFGCLLAYLLVDALADRLGANGTFRWKLVLVYAIILLTVVAQSAMLIALRSMSTPASFTHDGGVIQTEAAAAFIAQGRNPYVEDYTQTAMTEWGTDLRTALFHFPYLPWTFVSAVPFREAGLALFGGYDQRVVYLLLFLVMLWLAPRLAADPTDRLSLTMVLGLNPIMGNDVIFGQNDSFVLFWLVLFAYGLVRRRWSLASISLGLAVASKPTAWFIAPFFLAYLLGQPSPAGGWRVAARRLLPAALVAAALVLPFAVWDLNALADDVWRWSSGTIETAYQIRGWGAADLVLALQMVGSRLDYFPFWIPQALLGIPVVALLLWRQVRHDNSIRAVFYGYALLSFVFLYFSRFLNENYLGYLAACLALGVFIQEPDMAPDPSAPAA